MQTTLPDSELGHLKVLLVEDERLIREIVLRMLNNIGIAEVTEAASAEAAWEYLAGDSQKAFEVVITDLMLPGISGGALIKKLRDLPTPQLKTLPVIVLTGIADPAVVKQVESIGISSYLMKPVSGQKLRTAITQAVVPVRGATGA